VNLTEPLVTIGPFSWSVLHLVAALLVFAGSWVLGLAAERWIARRSPESWLHTLSSGRLQWLLLAFGALGSLEVLGILPYRVWLRAMGSVLDARLFDLGDKPVTISTVGIVLLVVAVSYQVSGLLQRGLQRALREQGVVADEGGVAVSTRLGHYIIVMLGAMVGLQTAGIDLSALFAAGAVFAVGLGFALQTIAQNFVSGIILIVEGSIKPGDILEVKGELVRVERLGTRATVVRNLDDVEVIVPNAQLVEGVKNFTMTDRHVRVRVPVGVSYDADMDQVLAVLQQAGEAVPGRSQVRNPIALWTGYGASSVDFEVSVWSDEPFRVRSLQSQMHKTIWDALKEAGITIAYPQLDVHLDPAVVRAIGRDAA